MKKKYILGCLISLVSLTATAIGVTYAAFQNTLLGKFKITDNIDYTSFFGGGNGEEATPYLLSTRDHLYNLQQLTQLGSFDGNTHFKLETDIDLGSDPMLPIGTENNPFYGQFDGNGKIISNAVISSKNLLDVGFFGYTSIGSSIKNFVLNNPLISSQGAIGYMENSLAEKFTTPLTLDYNGGQFTISNLPTADSTYEILTVSSDKTYISNDGKLLRTNNEERVYVSYIVMARAMTMYKDKPVVQTYTAARFRICIEPNGEIPEKYKEKEKDALETVNLYDEITVQPTKVSSSDPDVTMSHGHPIKNDKIVAYTGIVAGHIDGFAENIGVYNGKMWMGFNDQESFNSLVGHYKNEKLSVSAGDLYYNAIDFNDALKPIDKWNADDFKKVTASKPGEYSWGLFEGQRINGVYNNEPIPGFEIAIGADNIENLNFYGGDGTSLQRDKKVYYYDENTDVKTHAVLDAIGFNNNVTARANVVNFRYLGQETSELTSYEIHNGIMFWANQEFKGILGSVIDTILGNRDSFFVSFGVTYSVENYPSSTTSDIDFKLFSGQRGRRTTSYLGVHSYDSNGNQVDTMFSEWEDESFTAVDGSTVIPIDPSIDFSEYDPDLDANKVHFKTLSLEVQKSAWQGLLRANTYPIYALGLSDNGKGYPDGFMLNVLKFEILITSKAGNVNSTINKIDFIATLDTPFISQNGVLAPGWEDSGVQIYISLILVPTDDKGIYLEFTRSSNTITATYNTTSTTDSATEYSPIPRNTVGAKMATLRYDNTLVYPA